MSLNTVSLDTNMKKGQWKPPAVVWSRCLPFVENSRAVLIHRPRRVHVYNIHKHAHLAVHYWCGNGTTGTKNLTFLPAVPEGRLVCARCDALAQAAGEMSTDALCRRHVHKGKYVAIQTCHVEQNDAR